MAIAASLAAWLATGFIRGSDPEPTVPLTAKRQSQDLLIYLVPSAENSHGLSPVNPGLADPALTKIPLVFDRPDLAFRDLRPLLWTGSSIVFSGTGFAGEWPDNNHARLVLRLNGPMKNAEYSQCLAIKINGEEVRWSCGSGFSSYEFIPGGYTVVIDGQSPVRLEPNDKLEFSFILATPLSKGETPVPNLVYGGDVPLRTSFLEIATPVN